MNERLLREVNNNIVDAIKQLDNNNAEIAILLKKNIDYSHEILRQGIEDLRSVIYEATADVRRFVVDSHNLQMDPLRRTWRASESTHHTLLDIMRILQATDYFKRFPKFSLQAERPVAIESDDHLFPRGTAENNTRYPRLVIKCQELFGARSSLLDLGCAGGGLVADFLFRGFPAVGLEGSDFSKRTGRAEWSVIPDFLFTCDIVKPFTVTADGETTPHKFTLVTAWEVLEHIPEQHLPQLFANVYNHLEDDGYFVASVAQFPDRDEATGAEWHVTLESREWWHEQLRQAGLEVVPDVFAVTDCPRGSGNGVDDWSAIENPDAGFHVAARKIR